MKFMLFLAFSLMTNANAKQVCTDNSSSFTGDSIKLNVATGKYQVERPYYNDKAGMRSAFISPTNTPAEHVCKI